MKSIFKHSMHDIFYWLKRPTVSGIRAVLEWAHQYAMATRVTLLDPSESIRRLLGDEPFEKVMRHIGAHAKPFFRVILRKNQNWYLLLTDEKHIEDLIEIK